MITSDCIYTKIVQYERKSKWRNCTLQIEIVRRCQDKLVALLNEIKSPPYTFDLYGYEGNNDCVSLIGNTEIYRIKFESLDAVLELTTTLSKYIKDVSFKFQLMSCNSSSSALQINEWYTFHVQVNGICLTSDEGSRLVTKWNRSNIGRCCMEDSYLKIDIYLKKDKSTYLFYREEKFALEKILKAIQNLKFELPWSKPDKFMSIPRRSGSVDLRRVSTWSSGKERIAHDRTYSSSRVDDSYDDSSPPSTPCSPLYTTSVNEHVSSSNEYNDLDEKPEEPDDLIFPIDSSDSGTTIVPDVSKPDECPVTVVRQLSLNSKKLVDLERFPYESDLKTDMKKDKVSSKFSYKTLPGRPSLFIHNNNVFEKSRNGDCYQTLNSIEHHRKPLSASNIVVENEMETDETLYSDHVTTSSYDKTSGYSSTVLLLSSSSISADTNASSTGKDQYFNTTDYLNRNQSRLSPTTTGYSSPNHNYYNIKNSIDVTDQIGHKYPYSVANDSHYFNLPQSLSASNKSRDLILKEPSNNNETSYGLNYVDLELRHSNNTSTISKKSHSPKNYIDIDHHNTQILNDIVINRNGAPHVKKKKKGIFGKLKIVRV